MVLEGQTQRQGLVLGGTNNWVQRGRADCAVSHRGWLGWCPRLHTVLLQLLLIYISVPFLIRLFPVILTKFVFLNFREYPSTESSS